MALPTDVTVGVDIGGTKILALAVAAGGAEVLSQVRLPTPADGPAVMEGIRAAVAAVCSGPPAALGLGVPCLVDGSGVATFSPHLPGLVGVALGAAVQGHWPGVPTWVGNDATAAVWAEQQLGAARSERDVLMVTLGTGIGGGIVSDGRLYEGAHRFAGEFGHMVVDPHGPPCPCGKRGCWERYASGSGLGQLGREAALGERAARVRELAGGDAEAVRGEHVTRAAAEGDAEALEVLRTFAWWLALGLANLANALDPRVIVLGGGLVEAGDLLLGPLADAFASLVEAPGQRGVQLRAAHYGERAGAVGAALMAAGNAPRGARAVR